MNRPPSSRLLPHYQEHGDVAEQDFALAHELAMAILGRTVGLEVSEILFRCLPPEHRASILLSCMSILDRGEGVAA